MNWTGSITSNEILQLETSHLWVIGILFFGVGDIVTTSIGFSVSGINESNPVVALLIRQYGVFALIGLKIAVFGACFGVWKLLRRPHSIGVPLALAVSGVFITAWNLQMLVATHLL